jgi:O-acetylserine/cysteine efflux transporter
MRPTPQTYSHNLTEDAGIMRGRNLALALAAPFCWGVTFTLAKPAVTQFPPLLMMLFSYLIVAACTALTVKGWPKTPWPKALIIAALGVPIQGALLFWAIKYVDASVSNLVLQTQVPWAVFLGWLLIGEPLTARKLAGTSLALVGVAIIIGLPERQPPLVPVLMIIASGGVWALGQVLVRKWSVDEGPMVLKSNALFGLPQLLAATVLFEQGQWHAITTATSLQWLNLAFVGFGGFYLASVFWFTLLKRVQVDEAIPFILLMTPIGIATAVVVLGESFTMIQVAGAVILMLGIAIVTGVKVRNAVVATS